VKAAFLLLSLPIAAALAFAPAQQDPKQDQGPTEVTSVQSVSELQYVTHQGKTMSVPARNVVEIRMFDSATDNVLLELLYDNGDYSFISAQAMHLLRNRGSTREVRLIRTQPNGMRFPVLP